jgi:hypothetical protein
LTTFTYTVTVVRMSRATSNQASSPYIPHALHDQYLVDFRATIALASFLKRCCDFLTLHALLDNNMHTAQSIKIA